MRVLMSMATDFGVVRKAVRIDGKFLRNGASRLFVKGISYGTFAPDANGYQFPDSSRVAEDFRSMAKLGINTVRTYTVPSPALLDAAAAYDLKVFVGMPWAQHIAFLDSQELRRSIRNDIVSQIRSIADHPALLACAIGNEIPANVVRWHGAGRIERFLHELYDAGKAVAPDLPLTYVNFPPTEFLDLSFFDICAFNVYLHRERDLAGYLARLQHLAGGRPLLITEAGADSCREGEEGQAALTAMQIRTAFAEGACGVIVFTWTDDWWRGGEQVTDWAFGLTDAERQPKLALYAAARAFASAGFSEPQHRRWPKISVLVCAYNAGDTIEDCLTSLERLNYPDFEVIVVNDGSRDRTGEIARRYPFVKLVETSNRGLSAARNTALEHASGEIVAYTDADVRVDPDWLSYLVQPFLNSDVVGVGGPNIVPPDDPWLAQCIARAPGGPTHVLINDRIAEHVPGCNMAYRRDALLAIGGFDPTYRAAGDDVDVCWRAQSRGGRIGFAPAALVWHHHRSRVRAYWRQQAGYGEAETWLMEHHPERFLDGNAIWRGRIYSPLPYVRSITRVRVNAGVWGTAPFPSVYSTHVPSLSFLPHTIQWQLITVAVFVFSVVALAAGHPRWASSLLASGIVAFAATVAKCTACAWQSDIEGLPTIGRLSKVQSRVAYRATITWLHFVQPLARAWGRLRGQLWPPQTEGGRDAAVAVPRASFGDQVTRSVSLLIGRRQVLEFWSEHWIDRTELLARMTARLRSAGIGRTVAVDDGWQQDRDLAVAAGRWAWLNVVMLVEEHARGQCLVRIGLRGRVTGLGVLSAGLVATVTTFAILSTPPMAVIGAAAAAAFAYRALRQLARTDAAARLVMTQICVGYHAHPLGQHDAPAIDAEPAEPIATVRPVDATDV